MREPASGQRDEAAHKEVPPIHRAPKQHAEAAATHASEDDVGVHLVAVLAAALLGVHQHLLLGADGVRLLGVRGGKEVLGVQLDGLVRDLERLDLALPVLRG